MTRDEFLRQLLSRIAALPPGEQQRLCEYYNEILLDRIENGWEEEAAVAELGRVDELAERALEEYVQTGPSAPEAAVYPPRRKRGAGWAVLKGFGWFFGILIGVPLFLAAVAVYACGWAVLASLAAAALSLVLAGLAAGGTMAAFLLQNPLAAFFQLGGGLFSCGLGILLGVGTVHLFRLYARFTRFLSGRIGRLFHRKGA